MQHQQLGVASFRGRSFFSGGVAKGKRLKPCPKGLRITQGKVRKVIFDVLSSLIEDKIAIDFFAGAGSIGIEALTRGAEKIIFIEKDKRLADIIKDNLKTFNLLDRGEVWAMDAFAALPVLKNKEFLFDIFFADPPYGYTDTAGFLEHLFSSGILAKDAKGVVEHSRHVSLSDYCVFKKWKEKKFGETVLSFYQG